MFYFYSTKQNSTNSTYYKGVLFEDILRKFLTASSYIIDDFRRKQNSLEYDLHGKHSIDSRGVIGEAKAHSGTISGQHVAAFIGKALPHLCAKEPYLALFLSTSALSPDGEDYLRNLEESTPYRITHICGSELENKIREQLLLPNSELIKKLCLSEIPYQSGQDIIHTDLGTFIVVLGTAETGALDDRFCLVSSDGKLVGQENFLQGIKKSIQALQELTIVCGKKSAETESNIIPVRNIPRGLITATDWFDYRKPASPEFFIGRQTPIQKSCELVKKGAIIEIKSKSGVGKSSLLSTLERNWTADGEIVELHDARDVHSANDLLSLVQRFTRLDKKLTQFEEIQPTLTDFEQGLGEANGIFMVDQFESTFQAPEVFSAYELLALCIARSSPKLAMVFARKDDLLTTHDENQISLERLRSISTPVTLDDFTKPEALDLIKQISNAHSKRLSPLILSDVLAFAEGFPWLLKRTMAHITGMVSSGINQKELVSSGLHLEDLFEEELSELDEQERGYLTRLAGNLPATYQSLSVRFEGDPFLREILEKLTSRRILRFSAGTYDTYNDVFKDFLLYERLPERSHSQIFRIGLGAVMDAFRSLKGQSKIDPEELGKHWGRKSIGGIYNTLREMRLAGLVVKSSSGWCVPDVVRQYEHQGRLGEFVRLSVLKNRVVSDFLGQLEQKGYINKNEIPAMLKNHFPFVEAKDSVWELYTKVFLDWLSRLRLVNVSSTTDDILPVSEEKEEIVLSLGNLNLRGRYVRHSGNAFIPMRSYGVVLRVLDMAIKAPLRPDELTSSEYMAFSDLRRLGALKQENLGYTAQGSVEDFENQNKEKFSNAPYSEFWTLLAAGVASEEALSKCFNPTGLSDSVRKDYGKKLAS